MKAPALMLLVVILSFASSTLGQSPLAFAGSRAQFTDLGTTINAWIDMLPTVGGYKAGRIVIPAGSYTQSTAVRINSPNVSIVGAGSGAVQITCTMNSPCWEIRLNPFVTNTQAGEISGFTLIGQAVNVNAAGIHMGDIGGSRLEDIVIQGFTGANAVGLWWDNINGWIERVNVQRVWLNGNTTNYKFTNSGGPATTSFCYNTWFDLRINVNEGQKGIDFQAGDLCGSTMMVVFNGAGINKTYISLTGASYWHDNFYDIKGEDDGGGGVRLSTAPGTIFNGTGIIANIMGPMTDSISGSFGLFLPYLAGTGFSSTSAPTQWFTDQFANLQVGASIAATATNNFSSPLVALKGSCWNGSTTSIDEWRFQNVLAPGANPPSTLQFAFTPVGCTAVPQFQVADGVGNGLLLSTITPGVTPRIRHDSEDNLVIDTGGAGASLYLNTDNNKPVKLGAGGTSGANIPIVASLTTNVAFSTNLMMTGVTNSSHCSVTATNASAAINSPTTFISAKTADQITVTHNPVAGMTYDVLCTPN